MELRLAPVSEFADAAEAAESATTVSPVANNVDVAVRTAAQRAKDRTLVRPPP